MPNRRSGTAQGRGPGHEQRKGDPIRPLAVPWELPHTFLGLDEEASDFETSRCVILPVPYESTTSWGGGTAAGPAGLVEASRYIELWDQELRTDPSRMGVHTLPALELTRAGAEAAMEELERAYTEIRNAAGDRFLIMVGGEHSISAPAIRSVAASLDQRPTVLQLDAHADLRPMFEGTGASHASAMFRVLDVADLVGVGIRGISQEEVELADSKDGVTLIYGDEMWEDDRWMDRAMEALGDPVYLTFDVDFLDPSFMPATGTPEPGGGDWYRTLRFLRRVFSERNVVACDIVELAPIPGMPAPDFLAAKLAYKMLGYRFHT